VHSHARENLGVLTAVSGLSSMRLLFSVLPAALFLAAGALYDALGLDQVPGVVAAVSVVIITVAIAGTVPYWNRVLIYARTTTGKLPERDDHSRRYCEHHGVSRGPRRARDAVLRRAL